MPVKNAAPVFAALLALLMAAPSGYADAPAQAVLGDVTLYSSSEGTLTARTVDGKSGWAAAGGTFLYGDVRPVKSSHLRLSFRLHDGGAKATVGPPYDSADERVSQNDPHPGAWKRSALPLPGTGAWTTVAVPHWVTITEPLWVRLSRRTDGHIEATVFNRSDKAQDGTITLTAPAGVTLTPASLPFHAAPWARATVQAQLSGLETQRAPIHMTARASAGNAAAVRTLMLYPPAANGDFEADSAGDGRPDWWHSYGQKGGGGYSATTDMNLARLDTDRPHSGKYCLRLDPDPGKVSCAEPFVHALDAGRKYHLRVAVRKTEAGDDAAVNIPSYQSLALPTVAGQWTMLDYDLTTRADGGDVLIQFVNKSRHAVWFDDLSVTPVP